MIAGFLSKGAWDVQIHQNHTPAHESLFPGAIIILHDGIRDAKRSLRALPRILAARQKKGLRFVSIGELMNAGRQQG